MSGVQPGESGTRPPLTVTGARGASKPVLPQFALSKTS